MAKLINGLLGNSRNKVGNLVTYVSKGQQIARSKAANISNPRTASQMTQRIKLSNVVAMYRANKAWMDRYAFESKPTRWSVFNAFVSANLSASLVALTKQEAAAGACVAAPYKMTDGSLPQIQINELQEASVYTTDLFIGDLVIGNNTTIGDLSAALIANNNGIVQGMQLSLIENVQEVINNIPRVVCRAYEFIINTTDSTLLAEKWSSEGLTTYTGGTSNAIAYDIDNGQTAFTFVLSHTYGGKTHVGASYMILNESFVYEPYTTSTAVDLAIQSYGSGNNTPFLDSTEAASSSSGDVTIIPSILGVRVGTSGNFVSPSDYLGGFGGESDVTLQINLSQEVDTSGAYVTAQSAQGDAGSSTAVSISDRILTATFAEVPFAPSRAITRVRVVSGGINITADFAASDDGVTE